MPGLVSLQTPPPTPPLQILLPNGSDDRPESRSARPRTPTPKKTPSPSPSSSRPRNKTPPRPDDPAAVDDSSLDNPDLGPFLLKQARDAIASGDSPAKALDLAIRASRSFERCASDGEPSLELSMSLHVVAAIYCSLGRFDDAVPVLERAVGVPDVARGPDHALAAFSGLMQLGDTHSMLGQMDRSVACYEAGLKIQIETLGEMDPRVAETCRYCSPPPPPPPAADVSFWILTCTVTARLFLQSPFGGSFSPRAQVSQACLPCAALFVGPAIRK
ncbi:Protein KINESIN LIGHT CHAIN-RELATED 1 [Asimina triloba]